MPVPHRPVEGAIVSAVDQMILVEQENLAKISEDVAEHLHIYLICRRPRIAIVPSEFRADEARRQIVFTAQHGETFERIEVQGPPAFGAADLELQSEWPYGDFTVVEPDGERLAWGRSSLWLTREAFGNKHLNLEVLYVGQAYGTEGRRNAVDRLSKHETLQAIYAEAVRRSPDKEVWIVLLGLAEPYGLILFSPVPGDDPEFAETVTRLTTPISEQQRINFTEAALIRYFQPPYNTDYKDTFPSPAHKTYRECYKMDVNSVAFEMETSEPIQTRLYSEAVPPSWWHIKDFPLHSPAERRSLFDFSRDDDPVAPQ
jgi:hypothetical protein